MRKKYGIFVIIFVLVIQIFGTSFSYVEAAKKDNSTEQPAVCSGPSDMFSLYVDFQNEMMAALGGSNIDEKRFAVSLGDNGLFAQRVLPLVQNAPSAINLGATSIVDNIYAMSQATIVTTLLLEFSAISVGESSIEGLWTVLFKDRPIVRDYRSLLLIETQLTELTYQLSKEVSLVESFDGDLLDNLESVIKKYQDLGLLSKKYKLGIISSSSSSYFDTKFSNSDQKGEGELKNIELSLEHEDSLEAGLVEDNLNLKSKGGITLASIISDLVSMNASMKHFIVTNGAVFNEGKTLLNYNGCLNGDANCYRGNAVLTFDIDAVNQLIKDYNGIGVFGSCSEFGNGFKNIIGKGWSNNMDRVKDAGQEIADAAKRLASVFKGTNDNGQKKTSCDMSYYEMAQLRAYYGGSRSCNKDKWIDLADTNIERPLQGSNDQTNIDNSVSGANEIKSSRNQLQELGSKLKQTYSTAKQYAKEKKAHRKLKKSTKQEADLERFSIYGSDSVYSSEYKTEIEDGLTDIYNLISSQYFMSEINAVSIDSSFSLVQIMALIEQVDKTGKRITDSTKGLQQVLDKIADYQCSN